MMGLSHSVSLCFLRNTIFDFCCRERSRTTVDPTRFVFDCVYIKKKGREERKKEENGNDKVTLSRKSLKVSLREAFDSIKYRQFFKVSDYYLRNQYLYKCVLLIIVFSMVVGLVTLINSNSTSTVSRAYNHLESL